MIQNYSLPDLKLLSPEKTLKKDICIWQPEFILVVMGNGSKEEKELKQEIIEKDKILVMRRKTGGSSVVLSNNMLCISIANYEKKFWDPKIFFCFSNKIIINALISLGINNSNMRGISDITINNKKISGSSIFQNNKMVFFHSVLNVNEDVTLIEKYLKYPPREPDYRSGRSHKNFVTSLFNEGYKISITDLKNAVMQEWKKSI